jgi:hypothetical protein
MRDRLRIRHLSPEANGSNEKLPTVRMYGCALIKGRPGALEHEHSFEFKVYNDKSEKQELILGPPLKLPVREILPGMENFPTGGTINLEIHIAVKSYGTSYLCLFIDWEESPRTPFTLSPPILQQRDN